MKLNYKRTFFIGLAFLSISAFWQIYDSLIPLILKHTFGIGDTLAGGIMALDNVLALFMLPLFGTLSDKVRTSIGRRMPFIIGGTAAAVVSMVLIPVSDNLVNLPMFISVLFLTLVAMSTYRSPAVALMPDVTPKPLRSKANGVINLMGAVGGIISLLLMSALIPDTGKPNYLPIFAIVAGLMVTAVVILVLTIKENKLREEIEKLQGHEDDESERLSEHQPLPYAVQRSLLFILLSIFFWFMAYNAVTTAFSKYAQEVLGMAGGGFANSMLLATAAAVVTFIPSGLIATRIGRKRTILMGIVFLFASFTVASWFMSYSPFINVLLVTIGMGWALINVNSYPMVVEMAKGSDVGKFTGYYYTFSMAGQIITPVLSGALLEYVGYRTLFPYAAFFSAVAFITMSLVQHGDSRPTAPHDKLELLDIED
ncbi:MAG: SLC45 family MFS transporter [Firmicutes bacterium]|nr:SLC45 family MFS transporter [Bacillota bacterium]